MNAFRAWAHDHAPLPNTIFEIGWRLAVLALPWQTRLFSEAWLAGWPWEQGSWAFYVSWILLALTVIFGFLAPAPESRIVKPFSKNYRTILWLVGVAVALSFVASDSHAASAQWLIQASLLVGLGLALRRQRVPVAGLSAWFVVSLIPQALLAYWQYAVQRVDAIKWLGIAFQTPKQLGVSVVEFADLRYLRAYGGMPHPNILGGWLVLGILAAWQSAWKAATKNGAFAWSAAGAVLGGALVLTFSRTAYLALAAGLASGAAVFYLKRKDERTSLQFAVLAIVVILVFSGILALTQREVLVARTDAANRLVVQSTDARLEGFRGGWQVFKAKPLVGSGPNAELSSLARFRPEAEGKKSRQPLESPHNVFFLILVNFGILGAGIFVYAAWRFRRALRPHWWLVPPLIILASLDHYLWSYWSGLALALVGLMLISAPEPD